MSNIAIRPVRKPLSRAGSRTPSAVIRVGFVPLVDAAPLLVGEALGFFAKAGLRVQLSQELGWGTVRDKMAYGELEATHAPGGLLLSLLFGTHAAPCRVAADCILNLQGNAITLSRRLWAKGVRDGTTLKLMIRSEAPHKPVFAVVSPFSSHLYLLRRWLGASGVDPDRDVRIAVLPPPLLGEHMNAGHIDGFCAGEPWNSAAALSGGGWIVASSEALSPGHPEKVLAVRESFFAERAGEYAALRRAVVAACRYCDAAENRRDVVDFLLGRKFFSCGRDVLANSLTGPFASGAGRLDLREPFVSFAGHDANRVTRSRAAWMLDSVLEAGSLRLDAARRRFALRAFRESLCAKDENS